jgi:hypothetical protein
MLISDFLLKPNVSDGVEEIDAALLADAKFWVDTHGVDHEKICEVLRRLLDAHMGSRDVLHLAGILAVIADDVSAWNAVQSALGEEGDPCLGVLAYIRLKLGTKDPVRLKSWFHIVEDAASRGSFDAIIAVAKLKEPKNMFLRRWYWRLKLFGLGLKATIISARNPVDPRLLLEKRVNRPVHIFEYI